MRSVYGDDRERKVSLPNDSENEIGILKRLERAI